jgi:hypothetical protein
MHHQGDLVTQEATAPNGRFLLLRRSFFVHHRTEPAHRTGGSRLSGLRDRIEALDGHLQLDSPRGAGTRLHVELPAAGRDTPLLRR